MPCFYAFSKQNSYHSFETIPIKKHGWTPLNNAIVGKVSCKFSFKTTKQASATKLLTSEVFFCNFQLRLATFMVFFRCNFLTPNKVWNQITDFPNTLLTLQHKAFGFTHQEKKNVQSWKFSATSQFNQNRFMRSDLNHTLWSINHTQKQLLLTLPKTEPSTSDRSNNAAR
mgnify:CR=1 FL=1